MIFDSLRSLQSAVHIVHMYVMYIYVWQFIRLIPSFIPSTPIRSLPLLYGFLLQYYSNRWCYSIYLVSCVSYGGYNRQFIGQVQRRLLNYTFMSNLCVRWVPHMLNNVLKVFQWGVLVKNKSNKYEWNIVPLPHSRDMLFNGCMSIHSFSQGEGLWRRLGTIVIQFTTFLLNHIFYRPEI